MDVSSSCFYGLDINSIKDPNNQVLKNVEKIFTPGISQKLKLFLLCKIKYLIRLQLQIMKECFLFSKTSSGSRVHE